MCTSMDGCGYVRGNCKIDMRAHENVIVSAQFEKVYSAHERGGE